MTFLTNAYGPRDAMAIYDIIQKAPKIVQDIWTEFAAEFRADKLRPGQTAHYAPYANTVRLNIRDARMSNYQEAYEVVFHEYGHMADYLMAKQLGENRYVMSWGYSDLYRGTDGSGKPILSTVLRGQHGGALGKTARSELEGHLRRMSGGDASISRRQQADRLLREIKQKGYSLRERGNLSDILEGAGIGVAFPLGVGHGLDYWRNVDSGKEIFAEITSSLAVNPKSLTAIREYFPKTYQVYEDMIKAWRKSK